MTSDIAVALIIRQDEYNIWLVMQLLDWLLRSVRDQRRQQYWQEIYASLDCCIYMIFQATRLTQSTHSVYHVIA